MAQLGDAILVRGPSLNENELWLREQINFSDPEKKYIYNHSGQLGAPKVIKNYPGETVSLTNGARPFILQANYITLSGFQFKNGKNVNAGTVEPSNTANGPPLITSKGNKVLNCTFEGKIGYDAVGAHGDDHVIAGNVCNLNGASTGTQGHCYYFSHGQNVQLLWNVAMGSWPGYGIHLYDQRRASADFKREIHNFLVEGNVLRGSDERSGMIVAMDDEGGYGNNIDTMVIRNNIFTANNFFRLQISGIATIKNIKIYNNTFYQNGRQGLHVLAASKTTQNIENVEIKNNIFDVTSNSSCKVNCEWYKPAAMEINNAKNVIVERNGYLLGAVTLGALDSKPIVGAIVFENGAADDWRVRVGSPTIDQGITLPLVDRDFRGIPRPQGSGYDIGAFELEATSETNGL